MSTGTTRVTAPGTVRAYVRLAKLDVPDYYIGILVVWSALGAVARLDPATIGFLLLFLAGEVLVLVAMVALDDRTGYLDGSDVVNYGPDAPARKLARKPLVAGHLTPDQAGRFALVTAVGGAALWAAAVAIAPHRPGWAAGLAAVTFAVALQYSWGVKLSYRGGQELFLAALGWALVLVPYGLATGGLDGFMVLQALLFGLGPLLFGVYSNTNDVAGDRGVGRPTVAALTTARGNAMFIGALSLAEAGLIAAASVSGVAPWWFVLAMLPTIGLRVAQYDLGIRRGDILRARRLGMWTHRVTVLLLVAVNLAAAA